MPRTTRVPIIPAVLFLGAIAALTGCGASPNASDPGLQPIYTNTGRARSLATDSPAVAAAPRGPGLPWYHDRKDRGMALIAGYRSPEQLGAYTRTHDYQHSSSQGRVHDHYSQHTVRFKSIEGAR